MVFLQGNRTVTKAGKDKLFFPEQANTVWTAEVIFKFHFRSEDKYFVTVIKDSLITSFIGMLKYLFCPQVKELFQPCIITFPNRYENCCNFQHFPVYTLNLQSMIWVQLLCPWQWIMRLCRVCALKLAATTRL